MKRAGAIAFTNGKWQQFGLATDLANTTGSYSAVFTTKATTVSLFARLNNNGTVQVEANTINGSLKCSGNFSVTNDLIFPNTVTGGESGQCAGL